MRGLFPRRAARSSRGGNWQGRGIMALGHGGNTPADRTRRALDALFAAEPDRLSRLSFDVAGIHFDWSKTHLDEALIDALRSAAPRRRGFAAARDALFAGGIVNPSEGRAGDPCRRARQRRARRRRPCDRRAASACGR